MADFKVRMSNAYPTGSAAFTAMMKIATGGQGQQQPAAQGWAGIPGLSSDGFARGTTSFRPPLSEAEATFAFRGLDSDHDGLLTQDEFLQVLWSGEFMDSSGPPQEVDQVLTTITSKRTTTTLAPTTTTEASHYNATNGVVEEEGESMGDHTDRYYTLGECQVLCDREPGCNSLSFFNGECHLKDRCVHPGDPVRQRGGFRTYYKRCSPEVFTYEELGKGYCPHGYYAGGDPFDAANLARCQARCSSEPQCEFISLHLKDTCSRYSSKAGDCEDRPLGQYDHMTYRRIALPPSAITDGVERLPEGMSTQSSSSSLRSTARAKEAPITMEDFKVRMLKTYASPMHAFQALGTNPSGLDDFVRGVKTFQPPLTLEQAQFAFKGLDTDHDDSLRSFEFFEVIECGHFFPTSEELAKSHESPQAYRVPSMSSGQQDWQPSVPALALAFGALTCLLSIFLAMGLRMAGKASTDNAYRRETYTVLPFVPSETTSVASSGCRRELISL